MSEAQPVVPRPPSRHRGARLVTRTPDMVRSLVGMREDAATAANRVRREEIGFAPADWTRGEPATSAVMANVHVTVLYRSGHVMLADILAGTGAASILEAQLACPDLSLTGTAVQSTPAGGERLIHLRLDMPDAWPIGEPHLVYVQARRVSGADSTTSRLLRAWQR